MVDTMPHIPILKPAEAPKAVQGVYEEFHLRMSFPAPPNFIMTQGHSATVARGTWEAVRNILVMGELPRWTKEMMFVAISKDRGCRYCLARPHRLLPNARSDAPDAGRPGP